MTGESRIGYRIVLCAIALLVGLAGCDLAMPLKDVPLVWKPTSPLRPGTPPLHTDQTIEFTTFKNLQPRPELIAENRENRTPRLVTTRDDVGAFVTAHVRQLFEKAGLHTVDQGGDLVVSGEVREFFVSENLLYRGRVVLHITVQNRRGEVLFAGSPSGEARRFGRSYEQENYYEVLADSLTHACSSLLRDGAFRDALQRH